MGASQPTVSANKQSNKFNAGFNSNTSLANTYDLSLTPALNISSGYAGSQTSRPATSLSTVASVVPTKNLNLKKGETMKWLLIISAGIGAFYIFKKVK